MGAPESPRIGIDEAIEHLGSMPAFVAAAIEAASPEDLAFRPGDDEFSLGGQACHLRDLEREGYLVRVRRILAEKTPMLETFDGTAVAKSRDYASQNARAAARDFAAARRELLEIVGNLREEDLARDATFEGKRITLADVIAMVGEHDRGHREEIEALVDAFESP